MRPGTLSSALELAPGAQLSAEVVVVGLGAGGSMVFHDLARAGIDVLALECGAHHPTPTMTKREDEMLPRLFMEGASRATQDLAIRVLQGKGVGGSTLHNTNLCKRLPGPLLELWAKAYGLGDLLDPTLSAQFDHVESMLDVHQVPPEQINANNRLFARGRDALGWRGGTLSHNRKGCRGSGFCELGCPNNGKQHGAKVLVPPGLAAGGRILTQARVERLEFKGQRITGVHAVATGDPGQDPVPFEVKANRVVLSASATNSAALVLASGLPDPYKLAGTNLHMHPGAFVLGRFEEPVYSWKGVPQAMDCTEHLSVGLQDPADPHRGRVWLVSGAAHPASGAALLPGFGESQTQMMRDYKHYGVLIAMLHDHCSGRVSPGGGEHVRIHYRLDRAEYEELARGLVAGAKIMLAAGAREVVIPLMPARTIRTQREAEAIKGRDLGPFNPPLVAVHPMSTLWMGEDPRHSVVDPRGRHHHLENLYVADGSLFPTSIGGPPQIPIYTMAHRIAQGLIRG